MFLRTLALGSALLLVTACQGQNNGGSTSTTNASTGAAATVASTTPAPTAPTTIATTTTANTAAIAPVVDDEPPRPVPVAPTAVIAIAPPGQPGAVPPTPSLTFSIVPATGVTRAEDGNGALVAAQDPVFLDVRGGVGGQALGPELSVGQLRFHDHHYPSPGVVRFICASKSLLPAGAEVALVYGSKRTVVSSALVLP